MKNSILFLLLSFILYSCGKPVAKRDHDSNAHRGAVLAEEDQESAFDSCTFTLTKPVEVKELEANKKYEFSFSPKLKFERDGEFGRAVVKAEPAGWEVGFVRREDGEIIEAFHPKEESSEVAYVSDLRREGDNTYKFTLNARTDTTDDKDNLDFYRHTKDGKTFFVFKLFYPKPGSSSAAKKGCFYESASSQGWISNFEGGVLENGPQGVQVTSKFDTLQVSWAGASASSGFVKASDGSVRRPVFSLGAPERIVIALWNEAECAATNGINLQENPFLLPASASAAKYTCSASAATTCGIACDGLPAEKEGTEDFSYTDGFILEGGATQQYTGIATYEDSLVPSQENSSCFQVKVASANSGAKSVTFEDLKVGEIYRVRTWWLDANGNYSLRSSECQGKMPFASNMASQTKNPDLELKTSDCFVVTAASGDTQSEAVYYWRYLRDTYLTSLGVTDFYYSHAKDWAKKLDDYPRLKPVLHSVFHYTGKALFYADRWARRFFSFAWLKDIFVTEAKASSSENHVDEGSKAYTSTFGDITVAIGALFHKPLNDKEYFVGEEEIYGDDFDRVFLGGFEAYFTLPRYSILTFDPAFMFSYVSMKGSEKIADIENNILTTVEKDYVYYNYALGVGLRKVIHIGSERPWARISLDILGGYQSTREEEDVGSPGFNKAGERSESDNDKALGYSYRKPFVRSKFAIHIPIFYHSYFQVRFPSTIDLVIGGAYHYDFPGKNLDITGPQAFVGIEFGIDDHL